jgi:hypothetical protein
LGTVSAQDLVSEATSKVLQGPDGQNYNLMFVLDKESNQILAKKQTGDDAVSQITNWQFNDGHFCLFDGGKGGDNGNNYVTQGSGNYVNFFLLSPGP